MTEMVFQNLEQMKKRSRRLNLFFFKPNGTDVEEGYNILL